MTEERDSAREQLFAEYFDTGSDRARAELIESYAPLAEFFAGRYRNRGAESEDLRQVAQLALIKALDRFDPDVGVKFSTFAGRTIDGELKRYFRDKTWTVRVPRALKELSADVRKTADQLALEHGRAATVDEIARSSSPLHEPCPDRLRPSGRRWSPSRLRLRPADRGWSADTPP